MSELLEQLCTIKQACFSEKAGRTTVYARIRAGHYQAVKIGGSTRLLVSSLKAFRKRLEGPITTTDGNAPMSVSTDRDAGGVSGA